MTENARFKRFSGRRWMAAAALLAAACSTAPVEPPPGAAADTGAAVPSVPVSSAGVRAELSSSEVADGAPLWITLALPSSRKTSSVIGHFEGIELPFFPDPKRCATCVSTVVGVPHGHRSGPSEIFVEVEGEEKPLRIPIQIVDGHYASERLKVNPRHVNPPSRFLPRIQSDIRAVGEAYSRLTEEKLWEGPFTLPIDSPITSPYGTKRMYNGELRNYHGGLDLKAAVGTPVRAAAGGVVAMAKDLFYTGNTVVLDHGYGVMTVYAHLSRVKVKAGQRLSRGQLIGLSGKTGRVTGPHLHWQTVIHHVKVDPARVLQVMK